MKLQPLSDDQVSQQALDIFKDIKRKFSLDTLPLLFRYLANSEPYLFYLWEKVERNIVSQEFVALSSKVSSFGLSSAEIIYIPSEKMQLFSHVLSKLQRADLEETVVRLLKLNAMLFLLALDLREDLKGAFTQFEKPTLLPYEKQSYFEETRGQESAIGSQKILHAEAMLAPLFGSQVSSFSAYGDFFAGIGEELAKLEQSEAYLKTRVELERVGLLLLESFPYRLNSSYKVFMELVGQGIVAYELLYLLTNIFPTEFPRLLLTTCIMKRSLAEEKSVDSL